MNVAITGFGRTGFSAGQLILVGHANGLARRGHRVRFVPCTTSYRPEWAAVEAEVRLPPRRRPAMAAARLTADIAGYTVGRRSRQEVQATATELTRALAPRSDMVFRQAAMVDQLRSIAPPADVTLATGYATALPVALGGTGALAYFMQHYEVLFADDQEDVDLARVHARQSYDLPLAQIANSSWLREKVLQEHPQRTEPQLCLNAIDGGVYFPDGAPPTDRLRVISYSGRGVEWKGFRDAAEVIRRARLQLPELEWVVFGGGAELPPENAIAPYIDLGFQQPADLRRHYSTSHVALCTSWYESFPLYPLEAMSCGCTVVSRRPGTEDYLVADENAVVVEDADHAALAQGLVHLLSDEQRRATLRRRGLETAAAFSWERATDAFEAALEQIVAEAGR